MHLSGPQKLTFVIFLQLFWEKLFHMENTSEGVAVNEEVISELADNLKLKGYRVVILNNEEKIISYIHQIPNDVVIGLGDSITTCTLKIRNILAKKGTLIYYGWNGDPDYNRSLETFESHPLPEYFLTRINYINYKGEMLLKDYSRNHAWLTGSP